MKTFAILVALAALAVAAPTTEHPLDDAAGVVPNGDEPALENELRALRSAGVDMAVVVVSTTGGQSIEAYARERARAYATGATPAAVLVLAVSDRKSRLEVSDPLRGKFPDARAQSILDNVRGYLRSGDYTGAIRAVIGEVKAGAAGIAPDLESPHPQVDDPSYRPSTSPTPPPVDNTEYHPPTNYTRSSSSDSC